MIGFILNMQKCKCCGRSVTLKSSRWLYEVCHECMCIWYDVGLTDPAQIGRYCLLAGSKGYFPFDYSKQMPEAEFRRVVLQEIEAL